MKAKAWNLLITVIFGAQLSGCVLGIGEDEEGAVDVGAGGDGPAAPLDTVPAAFNDTLNIQEDTLFSTIDVLKNDVDEDGDLLRIAGHTQPENGTVTVLPNGLFSYVPDRDFFGQDSFEYFVEDDDENESGANVTVDVSPVNDAPILVVSSPLATDEDQDLVVTLIATDIDSESLEFTFLTQAQNGSIEIADAETSPSEDKIALTQTSNPTARQLIFTYTPNENYNGTETIEVQVSDGDLLSPPLAVTLEVLPVNDAPAVEFFETETDEDHVANIIARGSDVDGDDLSYRISRSPSNGTVSVDGSIIQYIPAQNFNGEDSFDYVANDGQAEGKFATVTIDVQPINDAPVSESRAFVGPEDHVIQKSLPGSDVESPQKGLIYSIVSGPQNGTVSIAGHSFTYTPNENYYGLDTFRYKVSDGELESEEAVIGLVIQAVADPVVARNDSYETSEDVSVDLADVLLNDENIDNQEFEIIHWTQPSHGHISEGFDGTYTYVPRRNFFGQDAFSYRIRTENGQFDSATVYVEITPSNDPPTADDRTANTAQDEVVEITLVGFDIEKDSIDFRITSLPTNGTLSAVDYDLCNVDEEGCNQGRRAFVNYIPNPGAFGQDTFQYVTNDGEHDSAPATVTVVVQEVFNTPPADELVSGFNHACARFGESVYCWGRNSLGQLGAGREVTKSSNPLRVNGLNGPISYLSAGESHTCALIEGGVYCWGRNDFGQLGNNSLNEPCLSNIQCTAEAVPVSGLESGVSVLNIDSNFGCVIKDDNTVWCWGSNRDGGADRNLRQVTGLRENPVDIDLGWAHVCVTYANATMDCWGMNDESQLTGVPTLFPVTQPSNVALPGNMPVDQMSLRSKRTCVVSNGEVYCWGRNGNYETAPQIGSPVRDPRLVTGIPHPVVEMTGGDYFNCVLTNQNEIYCWGANDRRQLGMEDAPQRCTTLVPDCSQDPLLLEFEGGTFSQLKAGNKHACALIDGEVHCWGDGRNGILGNDSVLMNHVPTKIRFQIED